ncbi:hypothetical protein BD779DRAFT_1556542 [Infundibulicybe gibba]|nr:hypothetical protein BD779DRAFT_1556542 [Infundibulicybe gibba]
MAPPRFEYNLNHEQTPHSPRSDTATTRHESPVAYDVMEPGHDEGAKVPGESAREWERISKEWGKVREAWDKVQKEWEAVREEWKKIQDKGAATRKAGGDSEEERARVEKKNHEGLRAEKRAREGKERARDKEELDGELRTGRRAKTGGQDWVELARTHTLDEMQEFWRRSKTGARATRPSSLPHATHHSRKRYGALPPSGISAHDSLEGFRDSWEGLKGALANLQKTWEEGQEVLMRLRDICKEELNRREEERLAQEMAEVNLADHEEEK